jgi:pilus assembly protein CpaE
MSSMATMNPNVPSMDELTIALIGPDEVRRHSASRALAGPQVGLLKEFNSYPQPSAVAQLMDQNEFDVVVIDLDSNVQFALDLVEAFCTTSNATVMVYSSKVDTELMQRCMRAGAREFLNAPFSANTMSEALVRAMVRRPAPRLVAQPSDGKLLVFLGAKGGSGVTTLATNFAVSLGQVSSKKTLLIDLDLPLGDAALGLGISAEYSTVNALENASRMDSNFLSRLLAKHSSGISVLAAPGKLTQVHPTMESVNKLISIARQNFDFVVVDAGSRLDMAGSNLFDDAATIYLVTQVGIPELRNSNRLMTEFFVSVAGKVEVVLNRYVPRALGIDEEHVTKALTRPAKWKVPGDFATARRTQNSATPLVLEDSSISRVIKQMAMTASGVPAVVEKKKKFLFG